MKKSYDRILYEEIQKALRNIKVIKDNPKIPYLLKKTELPDLNVFYAEPKERKE